MERKRAMFSELHLFTTNAMVVALVFTAIAGSRTDNRTIAKGVAPAPSSSAEEARPDLRLFAFGTSFAVYLLVKAYEIVVPDDWFGWKLVVNELSIWIGVGSLLALLLVTTTEFTFYAAVPLISLAFVLRFVVTKSWFLEACYKFYLKFCRAVDMFPLLMALKWKKWRRTFTGLNVSFYARRQLPQSIQEINTATQDAAYRAVADIQTAVNEKKLHWDNLELAAKYRARLAARAAANWKTTMEMAALEHSDPVYHHRE